METLRAEPEYKMPEPHYADDLPLAPQVQPQRRATDTSIGISSTGSSRIASSLGIPPSVVLETEKPHPYLLKFGPWWQFCSSTDRQCHKTRILPSVAAILMPITVLFVLTSVEANWIMSGPGYNGYRLWKETGYVVGDAIATGLAFISALTIALRQGDYFRKFFSLRIALFLQLLINSLLGMVCILVGALYQRNQINGRNVWITPEYPCIYIGGFFAFLQALLLLADYATTPNFNKRGHGYGGLPMQAAIGLANVVAIWTGFGSMIFDDVEDINFWHPYNSCFNAWVMLITTGSTVLNIQTVNSKVFVFFWLPIGVLIMFVFFWCFGVGCVQRFDEKPLRRLAESENQLRSSYRAIRRDARSDKGMETAMRTRIESLQRHVEFLQDQRLRYFAVLFVVGVMLKICSWLLGSIIFALTEPGWSYWDSMVFLFFNLLTVGIQGMVPGSSAGMPLYHAYTFIDILCTAMLDTILLHILWNLVPWPRYLTYAKSILATVTGKLFRGRGGLRRRNHFLDESNLGTNRISGPEAPEFGAPNYTAFTRRQAADQIEDAINVASRMRDLLVRNGAAEADILEYDRLLLAAESRVDDIRLSDIKTD